MKYLLVLAPFLLTGCVTPVKHAFPAPPPELLTRCPQLKQVAQDEERLTEFLKVVTENYNTYYTCAVKDDALVEWIQKQKIIHDDVFNK